MDRQVNIRSVKITGGLLRERRKTVAEKTVPYIKRALNNEITGIDPSGAFENFRAAAGESRKPFFGLVSQDSDLFKWMEAASLALQFEEEAPEVCDQIRKDLDEAVRLLDRAQQKDGYLNSYYILNGLEDRWNYLKESCQLYCAGHLMEAAVSDYEVTREEKLLEIAQKYADCIWRSFGPEDGKIHGYDGHAEVEIGLYRLYHATGIDRYRNLADYFVEERGRKPYFFSGEKRNAEIKGSLVYELEEKDYRHSQSHLPVREQKEAVGHAVKAMYFFTAAAEKAELTEDEELLRAVRTLWASATKEKMYLTGAIGASEYGESFSYPFDLPPDLMYGETCASIGLFLFAFQMLLNETDSRYADVMERALYNGILAGISQDGTQFFYTNALEIDPEKCEQRKDHMHLKAERQPWFECPCCPANIARLLLGLNRYIYTKNRDSLHIHLFADSTLDDEDWTVHMRTEYPEDGKVMLSVKKCGEGEGKVKIRIPGWCRKIDFLTGGREVFPDREKGYAVFGIEGKQTVEIELRMEMIPERVYADIRAKDMAGKAAVMRGPVVYCAEEKDNGDLSRLFWRAGGKMSWEKIEGHNGAEMDHSEEAGITERIVAEGWRSSNAGEGLYTIEPPLFRPEQIILIPYFRWNNRGRGAMRVFLNMECRTDRHTDESREGDEYTEW